MPAAGVPGGLPPWRRRARRSPVESRATRRLMKRRSPVVCVAFSGGLDTTYCAVLLREEGSLVHAVTVDTGGFSAAERKTITARAKAARVAKHLFVDGQREVYEDYVLPLLFGNV